MNMIRKGQIRAIAKNDIRCSSEIHSPYLWDRCLKNRLAMRASLSLLLLATLPKFTAGLFLNPIGTLINHGGSTINT